MNPLMRRWYQEHLYQIKTTAVWHDARDIIQKELPLTLRERLAILFKGGISLTIVHSHRWNDYVKGQLEKGA